MIKSAPRLLDMVAQESNVRHNSLWGCCGSDHKHRKQKEQHTIKDMMGILSKWEKSITIVGILQRLKLPVLSLRPGYEPCS